MTNLVRIEATIDCRTPEGKALALNVFSGVRGKLADGMWAVGSLQNCDVLDYDAWYAEEVKAADAWIAEGRRNASRTTD